MPTFTLEIDAVEPSRGPFTGGNVVRLRGSALDAIDWSDPAVSVLACPRACAASTCRWFSAARTTARRA
jgi:hypothetical protein